MKVVVCFTQGVSKTVCNVILGQSYCMLILDTLRLKPLLTSLNVCIYKLMLMFDAWMAPIRRRESLA